MKNLLAWCVSIHTKVYRGHAHMADLLHLNFPLSGIEPATRIKSERQMNRLARSPRHLLFVKGFKWIQFTFYRY